MFGWRQAHAGWRLAHQGPEAGRVADGAALGGDGTLTMPDGTIQRPGVERVVHGQVAAATPIAHGASKAAAVNVKVLNATGAQITMTATPNIEAGSFPGQLLFLEVDEDSDAGIELQAVPTLAGSKLRLTAGSIIVNARDTIQFEWSDELGEWWLFGGRSNNL
jgi:hypothetical protein